MSVTPLKKSAAFEALLGLVNNSFTAEPVGGATICIRFNPTRERYEVNIEAGETGGFGAAPTMATALVAASYTDEGDAIYLGDGGEWLCPWCVDTDERCDDGCRHDHYAIAAKVLADLGEGPARREFVRREDGGVRFHAEIDDEVLSCKARLDGDFLYVWVSGYIQDDLDGIEGARQTFARCYLDLDGFRDGDARPFDEVIAALRA